MGVCTERRKIATGIDDSTGNVKAPQYLERAVNRETLGDAAEIDRNVRAMKTHGMFVQQFDRIA